MTPTLERHKAGGAVAEKLEIAYLRWLDFGPAAESRRGARSTRSTRPAVRRRRRTTRRCRTTCSPTSRAKPGRLGLAIHIHVANGGGANYDQRGANPLLLTWAFNEPSLRKTTFVIVHGGYPHYRETVRTRQQAERLRGFLRAVVLRRRRRDRRTLLRGWLSQWPEKVLYGSDATPNTDETSWEETGWIASQTAREALAIALTGMIHDGEITRARASRSATMVLRDNAKKLYGF